MYKVYWIRLPEHINIASEGYVGITKQYERRMIEHRSQKKGYHITNAIAKYGWDNLECDIVATYNTLEEALSLESLLRAKADTGWNTLAGGLNGNGKPHSKFTKDKISKAMLRNSNTNGFEDVTLVCPFCKKEGQKAAMLRWHFNNCKEVI